MELKPGDNLGRYQLLSPIGEGGMGEVWKAPDTQLDRDVALKVSRDAFTAWFDREARAIAAFNHPNICQIYDVGPNYLVMELIDGVPLKGPLPVEKAVEYAGRILDALDAAHRKGFTHRDLKPANILVTKQGLKLLDFGLAKQSAVGLGPDDETGAVLTAKGQISGTLQYMSPEQLQGKEADARSDIFAFGCVLYEMLSGTKAFSGSTGASVIAAILEREPQPLKTTPPLDRVIRRCLAKDPDERFQDARDLKAALLWAMEPATPVASNKVPGPKTTIAAAGVLAALLASVSFVHFREKPPATPAVARFQISLPEKVSFTSTGVVTLSPDGRHIAFSAIGEDKVPRVLIQDLDSLEARVLRDTYTGPNPPPFFWSPDGRFVVYSENSPKLKKADVQTGALEEICEKPGPPIGGAWNNSGAIIFGSTSTGLWKVSAAGGKPAPLTVLDASRHERQHELPSFLPDGKHFLCLRVSTVPEETGIFAGSVDDPPDRQSRKRILATGLGAYFVPSGQKGTGKLVFLTGDILMAQSFDPAKLELSGEPVPVARGVGAILQTGYFSVSPETLAYRTSASIRDFQLTWLDRQGKQVGTAGEPGSISNTRISPDETRVAYRKDSFNLADRDIWLLDLNRNISSRFTFGPGTAEIPLWSPDGSELVFSSNRDGVFNLYRKPANGAHEETPLLRSNLNKRAMSWSKDGKYLLYCTSPSVVFDDSDT